jgi:hypothetical protein
MPDDGVAATAWLCSGVVTGCISAQNAPTQSLADLFICAKTVLSKKVVW